MVDVKTESFATKYRPCKLKDVVGQQSFKNLVKQISSTGIVPKAVLFTGNTGCGKTTLARVLARYINKVNEISQANDIFEYNIGVNGTADDIRDLVSKLRFMPRASNHKSIYILDEVHRLTKTSASALLKEIEEPPSHVVFILCTNEPDGLLPTIRNRCQKVNIAEYTNEQVVSLLSSVCSQENLNIEDKFLEAIAEGCGGQLREALVTLQSVASEIRSGHDLTDEQISTILSSTTSTYAISKTINRFLTALYLSNCDVAMQELLSCEDCSTLLQFALTKNKYIIKQAFGKPNQFWVPGDGSQLFSVIKTKIDSKTNSGSQLLKEISCKIHGGLLDIKAKSLVPAFNLQDLLVPFVKEVCTYTQRVINQK